MRKFMIYTFVILCHPARYLRCSAENINEKKINKKHYTSVFPNTDPPPKKKPPGILCIRVLVKTLKTKHHFLSQLKIAVVFENM